MKYNCEIKNDGALPIAYVRTVGSAQIVGQLFKGTSMYHNLMYVTFSSTGQVTLKGTEETLTFQCCQDLVILPIWDNKSQTVAAPDKTKQD